MDKKVERTLIFLIDLLSINLAYLIYFYFKVESGFFEVVSNPLFFAPMALVYFYWLIIFTFVGMYRTWFASSRFEELTRLFKSTFVGIFIIFFVILFDDFRNDVSSTTRFLIFIYWGILIVSTSAGRLIIRSIQRNLLINGIGRKKTLIIGFNPKANNIHNSINEHKALGLDVFGYLAVKLINVGKEYNSVKVIDTYKNVKRIVEKHNIKQIIFALEKHEEEILLDVIDKCDDLKISLKIVPDLYDIISGQARTAQIYGFPLIDIMPQLMPDWEKKLKRILDLVASLTILVLTAPITIASAIIIKLESKGPILYKQERLGLEGKPIKVMKFRSMVNDAEKKSGPVWAQKNDPRVTKFGNFMRKTRIDEIPQMFNILKGEMSLVGPRPERAHFVEMLSKEIPLYKRRMRVRPGVTGWAQVKHKYDESVDDVKTKLKYDLFYIENMSIRMDISIMFRTILVVFFGKGQ